MSMKTNTELIQSLTDFIGPSQLACLKGLLRGEEGDWFKMKLSEIASLIATMATTGQQDGKGDQAIVYLHYFVGGCDWWITEKDIGFADDAHGTGQIQAFGLVDLGYGPELGYISLPEVFSVGAELDLHWKIKTLAELKSK